ncbi:MAG: BrxA/BrxB family bacilliredoxin [Melioribacteraceae bacterium]|nr:BrxA/BrxB family bacilliredoxin [Melioribacteraceae bacterium]MCF8266226.1 BrxA/BrxB family bacilliredoxin [Melioribacteraceae bacterium]MCF8413882.1 BrxA/BrxB family bacilliredoxin [Melioribacteraceae bacterium]
MININQRPPMYDPVAVQPMRDELLYVGFEELTTPEMVDEVVGAKDDKTVLVVINSVCGCAAGSARPSATSALQSSVIPDKFVTVFAGQDRDAVDHMRQNYVANIPPSSPSMFLMKNGEVLFALPRHHIEGRTADELSNLLTHVFAEHCSNTGPSITPEQYEKLVHARACGSKIPLNEAN